MKVIVRTLLTQELEVPEGWDRYDVLDFLSEVQSFRTAFQGVSNEDPKPPRKYSLLHLSKQSRIRISHALPY